MKHLGWYDIGWSENGKGNDWAPGRAMGLSRPVLIVLQHLIYKVTQGCSVFELTSLPTSPVSPNNPPIRCILSDLQTSE